MQHPRRGAAEELAALVALTELSMGMGADLEAAIAEGATVVRVGARQRSRAPARRGLDPSSPLRQHLAKVDVFSQIAVLRCSRCSWTQELLHRPVLRELDEHASPASSTHAWCADQARVVLAERVPSPEDLLQERATIAEVRASADDDDLVEVPTLEWMDEQIRWRAQRVEPAKCFDCGGTRISPERSRPGEPSPSIEHPGCGGEIRATELLYTSGEPPPIVIDAEGRRRPQ